MNKSITSFVRVYASRRMLLVVSLSVFALSFGFKIGVTNASELTFSHNKNNQTNTKNESITLIAKASTNSLDHKAYRITQHEGLSEPNYLDLKAIEEVDNASDVNNIVNVQTESNQLNRFDLGALMSLNSVTPESNITDVGKNDDQLNRIDISNLETSSNENELEIIDEEAGNDDPETEKVTDLGSVPKLSIKADDNPPVANTFVIKVENSGRSEEAIISGFTNGNNNEVVNADINDAVSELSQQGYEISDFNYVRPIPHPDVHLTTSSIGSNDNKVTPEGAKDPFNVSSDLASKLNKGDDNLVTGSIPPPVRVSQLDDEINGRIKAQQAASKVLKDAELFSSSNEKMDIKTVIARTLETNPTLGMAAADEAAFKYGIDVAKSGLRPQVSIRAQGGVENTYPGSNKPSIGISRREFTASLNQSIWDFGKRELGISRAESLFESSKFKRYNVSEQLSLEIVNVYLDLIEQQNLLYYAQLNVKEHERIFNLVNTSEQGGNSTIADVKRVETRLENAKKIVLDFESQLQAGAGSFRRLTGFAPGVLKAPKDKIEKVKLLTRKEINKILDTHPSLKSIKAEAESYSKQAEIHKKDYLPDITFSAEAGGKQNIAGRNDPVTDLRGLVVLDWKLYDGGGKLAQSKVSKARQKESEYRYHKVRRELEEEMLDVVRLAETAKGKVKVLQDRVNSAVEVANLYQEQFKAGQKTIFEVLDAQQDLFTARIEKLQNDFLMRRAYYASLRYKGSLLAHFSK